MRKAIIAVFGCIVLLLVGYSGYRGYKVWKQAHLLAMAKGFAARSDARNELLSLQQVILVNPRNVEACRMMADMAEADRSPSALIWRDRVLELNPKSMDDRLALAQAAMVFKDFATASNTLAGVDEAGKKSANYHNISGVMAIGMGQMAEAEKHFSEAARLEPTNPAPLVNLDIVRLHGTNAADLAQARVDLSRISQNSPDFSLRHQATRELIMDAVHYKDYTKALSLCQELTQPTNAVFSDKLLQLDVLKAAQSADLKPLQAQYQREAAADPAKLAVMTPWLMTHVSPASALVWLQSLPMQLQTNPPAALLVAECQMLVKDWPGLQTSLDRQNWSELEFVRHAFLARALRAQGLGGTAAAEWELALKFASSQKGALVALFRLAAEWKWIDEAEEILWTIVNRYPEEKWAGTALQQALILGGRTRPLMQYYIKQANRYPSDLEVENNLALVAMLLDSQEIDPYGMSRVVYEKSPRNSSYASTYAFSLYLQKQYTEALKVMQQISPKELNDPSVAGYYGLILKATGDNAKASAYLSWAITKAPLLPEERKLFQQALNR